MAFFDFLGKDIGGMTQGINDPGGLGIHPGTGKTGMTWGNLLQAAIADRGVGSNSIGNPGMPQQVQPNIYQLPGLTMPTMQQKNSNINSSMSLGQMVGSLLGIL